MKLFSELLHLLPRNTGCLRCHGDKHRWSVAVIVDGMEGGDV